MIPYLILIWTFLLCSHLKMTSQEHHRPLNDYDKYSPRCLTSHFLNRTRILPGHARVLWCNCVLCFHKDWSLWSLGFWIIEERQTSVACHFYCVRSQLSLESLLYCLQIVRFGWTASLPQACASLFMKRRGWSYPPARAQWGGVCVKVHKALGSDVLLECVLQ